MTRTTTGITRKTVAALSVLALATASLAACGSKQDEDQASPTATSSATETFAYPTCPQLGGTKFLQEPGEAVTATVQNDCSVILQAVGQDATSTLTFADGSFSGHDNGSATWYTNELASFTYIPEGLLDSAEFPDAFQTGANVGINANEMLTNTWLYYVEMTDDETASADAGESDEPSASATRSTSAMLFRLETADDEATASPEATATSSAD